MRKNERLIGIRPYQTSTGDMASHMSDSETSNVYHGLSTLNSDITRSLLEMHSKQRNVKGENYENHG